MKSAAVGDADAAQVGVVEYSGRKCDAFELTLFGQCPGVDGARLLIGEVGGFGRANRRLVAESAGHKPN